MTMMIIIMILNALYIIMLKIQVLFHFIFTS